MIACSLREGTRGGETPEAGNILPSTEMLCDSDAQGICDVDSRCYAQHWAWFAVCFGLIHAAVVLPSTLCRQINGGKDLPREFLEDVFDSIKNNEIQVGGLLARRCLLKLPCRLRPYRRWTKTTYMPLGVFSQCTAGMRRLRRTGGSL